MSQTPAPSSVWAPSLLLILVFLCSCSDLITVDVDNHPEGKQLRRSFRGDAVAGTFSASDAEVLTVLDLRSSATLESLESMFPNRIRRDGPAFYGEATTQAGVFRGAGSTGAYSYITSPLGDAYHYAESWGRAAKGTEASPHATVRGELIADLLLAWEDRLLVASAAGSADQRRLRLERDLPSLCEFIRVQDQVQWETNGTRTAVINEREAELLETVRLWFLTRGYRGEALQRPMRSDREPTPSEGLSHAALLDMWVETMGLPAAAFAPFADREVFLESWSEFIRSDLARGIIAAWLQRYVAGAPAQAVAAQQVALVTKILGHLDLHRLWGFGWYRSFTIAVVGLETGVQPFRTNGDWVPERKRIAWSIWIPGNDVLRTTCYAEWSKADEVKQVAALGAILVDGQTLAEFNRYFERVDTGTREWWSAAVEDRAAKMRRSSRLMEFLDSAPRASLEAARLVEIVLSASRNTDSGKPR